MGRWGGCWTEVPPPCPVDDTPYTACTPESVAVMRRAQQLARDRGVALPPGTVLAVTVERPPHLPPSAAPAPPAGVPAQTIGPAFTTKTYRGKHPKPPRK